jgi:hypothetical protein
MIYVGLLILAYYVLYKLSRTIARDIFRVIYGITKSEKASIYTYSFLFLPGTFIHEISHFITALFLLVPVKDLDLIPTIQENRIKMGSVKVAKVDPFRSTIVGLAPFIFGNLILFLVINFILKDSSEFGWLLVGAAVYLIFQIGNTMFSSKEDMYAAIRLALVLIIIYVVLYFLGLRISVDANRFFTPTVVDYIKTASWFLLIPIVIDLIIITILKLTRNILSF